MAEKKERDFSQSKPRSKGYGQGFADHRDADLSSLFQHVFMEDSEHNDEISGASAPGRGPEKNLGLHNLATYLERKMEETTAAAAAVAEGRGRDISAAGPPSSRPLSPTSSGRIGPPEVILDILSNIGTLIMEPDRLGAASHSNFSTMKANSCVYKGKWVYEVMLGSKGVMQLGWCTINCRFSQEEGVGDTPDSYAYDGSRLRKWNVRTYKYGEAWLTGDVISCALDLDQGCVEFFSGALRTVKLRAPPVTGITGAIKLAVRNGNSMGVAFSNVKTGPGFAYFPAFSLSMGENVQVNFGATPLRFPIPGYHPLQEPKLQEAGQADVLLQYVDRLVSSMVDDDKSAGIDFVTNKADLNSPPLTDHRTRACSSFLVAAHIMDKLGPLMRIPYVIESSLLPLLTKLSGGCMWRQPQPRLIKFLDLLWALLQDFEIRQCMENLATVLLSLYRFSPVLEDFGNAKRYLSLTVCILRHQQTRRFLLGSILFDKLKFPIFMHIKPPDDAGLAHLIPTVWWHYATKNDSETAPAETKEEQGRKGKYTASCERLRQTIEGLEDIQVEMLKLLLLHTDVIDGKTSRDCFLEKFRTLLKESSGITWVFHSHTCPLPVLLCFFHRLLRAVRHYWDSFQLEDPGRFVLSDDAFVPIQIFWSDSREASEFQRCGGLMSHLNRTLGPEVNKAQGLELRDDGKVVSRPDKKTPKESGSEEYPCLEMPSGNTLMELVDGLILLYHSAAHKQLSKMWALQDNMKDFVLAFQDTRDKLERCPTDLASVNEDLEKAGKVFQDKVTELSRHMAWVIAVVYSQTKQRDVEWLLRVVLRTLEKGGGYRQLFQYVPEFYIETCIHAFNALRNYFNTIQPFRALPNVDQLLQQYATFLVDHFADPRIVSNDLRDNVVQALALFTCHRDTLTVLENLPMTKRLSMIESLLAPYENRSWAHTNWILVRLWKGCGFANRYRHLPNLLPAKVTPTDFTFVSVQEPCPSQVFQSLLAKTLLDTESLSTHFLDTLMNQLNWSFSEFVGMMQEIQQMTQRSDVLLEGRQVKICAACFEISVCLLRVLEMVATVAPQLFTDWSRPSAELFIKRIMQLLSQIVMRVTVADGAFESLVTAPIPGLDSVTYFPVLAVTLGILAQLIVRCGGSSQEKAVRALLTDTGFQPSALDFVLGRNADPEKKKEKVFSFQNFEEVSAEELQDVESLITHLRIQHATLGAQTQDMDDDDMCTICYANAQTAIFVPCQHKSCRTCITQQLLSKRECFFCKAAITAVQDHKGRALLREYFATGSPRK